MFVESELNFYLWNHLHLSKNINHLENVKRDIEIISYYYGFREDEWPTQYQTAKKYSVGISNTRSRINQILDNFRKTVSLDEFPSLKKCSELLTKYDAILLDDFSNLLFENHLCENDCNIRGLLNYLHDFGMCRHYEIYSPDLIRITRGINNKYDQKYLFTRKKKEEFHKILKELKKIPGMQGIAQFHQINYLFPNLSIADQELLKNMIRSQNSWTLEREGEFWYMFEERENVITNYSRKLFSLIDCCDISTLAEVYRNALDRRSNDYYPTKEIIELYLKGSNNYYLVDGEIKFLLEVRKLNKIEQDVEDYLKDKDGVEFKEIKKHLLLKGHSNANICKAVFNSPIVYVNTKGGRDHYKYSKVLSNHKVVRSTQRDNRYYRYQDLLKNILVAGTNETVEQKRRREQRLLRDWLFDGKKKETCALCGKEYQISALVAAHKKNRSKCSESERVDPNIVMPLCSFGCDYLYEEGYVFVDSSRNIVMNKNKKTNTTEDEFAYGLEGKKLLEKYFKGSESYFDFTRKNKN